MKDGYGVYSFPSGEKYEGQYKQDLRHGKGKYTYKNGATYDGDWRSNR